MQLKGRKGELAPKRVGLGLLFLKYGHLQALLAGYMPDHNKLQTPHIHICTL